MRTLEALRSIEQHRIATEALTALLSLLIDGPNGFRQPTRGHRAGAPQTAFIVTAKNRLARVASSGSAGQP